MPFHFSTPPPVNSRTISLLVRVCWGDVSAEVIHQTALLPGDTAVPRRLSCPSPSVLYPRLPQKQHLPMTSRPKADAKSKIMMGAVGTTSTVVSGIFPRALSPSKNICKDSSTCAHGASSIHH